MISISIAFLDNFKVIDRSCKDKNLQYFLHNLNNKMVLTLNNTSHLLIKLNFIIISLNYIVLVHISKNIGNNSPTKLIVILQINMIMIF
jgi:hypothetical protein